MSRGLFFQVFWGLGRAHCFSFLKVTVFLIRPQHLSFRNTKYSFLWLAVHFLLRWQKQDLGPLDAVTEFQCGKINLSFEVKKISVWAGRERQGGWEPERGLHFVSVGRKSRLDSEGGIRWGSQTDPLCPCVLGWKWVWGAFRESLGFCRHQTRTLCGISVYRDSFNWESCAPPGGWVWWEGCWLSMQKQPGSLSVYETGRNKPRYLCVIRYAEFLPGNTGVWFPWVQTTYAHLECPTGDCALSSRKTAVLSLCPSTGHQRATWVSCYKPVDILLGGNEVADGVCTLTASVMCLARCSRQTWLSCTHTRQIPAPTPQWWDLSSPSLTCHLKTRVVHSWSATHVLNLVFSKRKVFFLVAQTI